MKTFPFLVILWALPLIGFSESAQDDYQKALDQADVEVPPRTPPFSDSIADPNYVAAFKKLPPDRREKLAAQLTQIVPRLAQEQLGQPRPRGDGPLLGISILEEIATDEQKIEAFRNLDIYGDSLFGACQALSTCEGPEGVRILKQYAGRAFPDLEAELERFKSGAAPVETEGQIPSMVRISDSLKALQGAYHPEGPIAAANLRDRFLNLGKRYGDAASVAALEKEFAKDIENSRQRREKLIREKQPNGRRNRNAGGNETSDRVSDPSFPGAGSRKWLWPGISIALLLLIAACRILVGWKTKKPHR